MRSVYFASTSGTYEDEWQHEDGDDTTDQQGNTGHGDDGVDGDDTTDQQGNTGHGDDEDDDDDDGSDSEYSDDDDDYEDRDDEDDHPLLEHAREVYASDSFRIFEHEYRKSLPLSAEVSLLADPDKFCKNYVSRWIGDSSKQYKVLVQWLPEIIVNCSCNYYSITGFLCSHSLECLRCFRLDEKLPDRYLLKWQLKKFTNDQIPKEASSLETRNRLRSADDCTKVSHGISRCNRSESPEYHDICTDYDYIIAPLLRHAKDIYKPEIYNMFPEEYRKSEYLSLFPPVQEDMIEGGSMLAVYKIDTEERTFGLYSEPPNGIVDCACGNFEATGILCCHALLVLYVNDIVKIPPQYLVPSHLKEGCYDAVNNRKFHGPKYADIDRNKRRSLAKMKIASFVRSKYNVEVDNGFMEEYLKEMSLEPSSRKKGCGSSISSRKAEVKFWDDHEIRSFSNKESVITRRNCDSIWRYLHGIM